MFYILFDLILIGGLSVGSLFYGISHLVNRRKLLHNGERVSAHVTGQGQNRDGRYLVLCFTVNGSEHHLQYAMPRKRNLPDGPLTLYYDPYHPENLLVKEDKTDLYGSIFCIVLGMVLAVITIIMAVQSF